MLFTSGKFTEVTELWFDGDIVLYFIIVIIKQKKYKHNISCLFFRWYEMRQVTDIFCLALVVTDETREYKRGPLT